MRQLYQQMSERKSQPLNKFILLSQQSFNQGRQSLKSPRFSYNPLPVQYKNPVAKKVHKNKTVNQKRVNETHSICLKCKGKLKSIKHKFEREIFELKKVYTDLKQSIEKQTINLKVNLDKFRQITSDEISKILQSSSNLMEQKNFRLEIQNFYKQQQIKQLKNLLEREKEKHYPSQSGSQSLNNGNDVSQVGEQQEKRDNLQNFLDRSHYAISQYEKTKKKYNKSQEGSKSPFRSREKENEGQRMRSNRKGMSERKLKDMNLEQMINQLQSYVQKGIVMAKGQQMQYKF